MKKIFISSLILMLILTGCLNNKTPDEKEPDKIIPERTISEELYSYDVYYWQNNENKQDKIAKEIYNLWKKNGEGFGINREVTPEVTRELVNRYIDEHDSGEKEKVFTIACTVIDVECDSYKVK